MLVWASGARSLARAGRGLGESAWSIGDWLVMGYGVSESPVQMPRAPVQTVCMSYDCSFRATFCTFSPTGCKCIQKVEGRLSVSAHSLSVACSQCAHARALRSIMQCARAAQQHCGRHRYMQTPCFDALVCIVVLHSSMDPWQSCFSCPRCFVSLGVAGLHCA
jgi:hypothetical protein